MAEAVHRQRHPLRAVPVPAAAAQPDGRGVPGQLPAHLLRFRTPGGGPRDGAVLTQTLQTLERDGMVHRDARPVIPPRVDYSLT
ncbi:winged helix-turn-helix transcriptional regulator, partial [Streptomyces pilosus]